MKAAKKSEGKRMKMSDSFEAFASLLDHVEIRYGKLMLNTGGLGNAV